MFTTPGFERPQLKVDQDKTGYRYSVEPFLLADFVSPAPASHILDVGTGCGILGLLLAWKYPELKVKGIEIQDSLFKVAKGNVLENGFENRVEMVRGDFSDSGTYWPPCAFDMLVSNPPYRKINSGRLNPETAKAIARHELKLTQRDLILNSYRVLKPGGILALIYPHHRFGEIRSEMSRHGVGVSRVRPVHGYLGAVAKIVLIEAVKGLAQECINNPPLYIYNEDGSYTEEMKRIYGSFNYPGRSHRIRQK